MPSKRRQPTANLFETDMNRAVNSQMVRTTSRSRKNALPENLTNFNAVEPRQVRNILKQDVKDARARMIESAATPSAGKRAYWADSDLRRQRHTACGAAKGKKGLRFLTEGSRDLSSDILPGCYLDPKGSRIYKGRGLAVPLIRRHYQIYGGALSTSDLEPYLLRLLHIRARMSHRFTSEMQETLEDAQALQRMQREGFSIAPSAVQQAIHAMNAIINNFPTGHQETKE